MNKLVEQTQTFYVHQTIGVDQYDQYKDEVNWVDAMRSSASRAMAQAILKGAGELEIVDPRTEQEKAEAKGQPWLGFDRRVEYRWTIRVVMPGELRDWFHDWEARLKKEAEIAGYKKAVDSFSERIRRVAHNDTTSARHMEGELRGMLYELSKLEEELAALPGINAHLVE